MITTWLILLLIFNKTWRANSEGGVSTRCENGTCISCKLEDKFQVELECPAGQVVTGILQAGFHSNNADTNCSREKEDCLSIPGGIFYHFSIKTNHVKLWEDSRVSFVIDNDLMYDYPLIQTSGCPKVTKNISYILVTHHKCVPAEDVHTICMDSATSDLIVRPDTAKHIISPYFMHHSYANCYYKPGYCQYKACSVNITTENTELGIHISSLFFNVPDPVENVSIRDNINGESIHKILFTGNELYLSNSVTVHFKYDSGNIQNKKLEMGKERLGFVLEYTSYNLSVMNRRSTPEEFPTTVNQAQTLESSLSDTSSIDQATPALIRIRSSKSRDDVTWPLSSIVVVIAVTACILLVAIGVIIYRRRRTHRRVQTTDISLQYTGSDTALSESVIIGRNYRAIDEDCSSVVTVASGDA